MRIRAGIDYNAVSFIQIALLQKIYNFAFYIGLKNFNAAAQFVRVFVYDQVYVAQCLGTVYRRLPYACKVKVYPMNYSQFIQLLRSSISFAIVSVSFPLHSITMCAADKYSGSRSASRALISSKGFGTFIRGRFVLPFT